MVHVSSGRLITRIPIHTIGSAVPHFGHKLHTSQTVEHDIIANYAVTTASVHDSQIDLSIPGIVNYKDKGYFGIEGRGIDATMDRFLKGYRLPVERIRCNRRITRKRSRGERQYSMVVMPSLPPFLGFG